ncbi:MAG: hypothetical protein R3B45_06975 [Bdellovibrionota bacterium]
MCSFNNHNVRSYAVILFCILSFIEFQSAFAITIMTYNTENLFDIDDNPSKQDESYLPLNKKKKEFCTSIPVRKWKETCLNLNWDREKLRVKIKRLSQVITSCCEGFGPDILVLQEVENKKVLELLRRQLNLSSVYKPGILINSDDPRGINIAVLTKLSIIDKPILYPIPFIATGKNKILHSRGILRVDIKNIANYRTNKEQVFSILAVHFPSNRHAHSYRLQAMRFLTKIAKGLPQDHIVIAAGDFNNTQKEENQFKLYKNFSQQYWTVSHLLDLENPSKILGTHYLTTKNQWSFLDTILIRNSDIQAKKLKIKSIQIINTIENQINEYGQPIGFLNAAQQPHGVSDHLPMLLTLIL